MNELEQAIDTIIQRDLSSLPKNERTIERWMKEFGSNTDYKATKEMLLLLIRISSP